MSKSPIAERREQLEAAMDETIDRIKAAYSALFAELDRADRVYAAASRLLGDPSVLGDPSGSEQATEAVKPRSGSSGTGRLTQQILDFAKGHRGESWGAKEIATHLGRDPMESSLRGTLKRLTDQKKLRLVRRGKPHKPTLYRWPEPAPGSASESEVAVRPA